MKPKPIITALLLAAASVVFAQEVKYDSAIISYSLTARKLYISVNGKEYAGDTIVFPKSDDNPENLNPFISKVHDFEKLGWLCIDIKAMPAHSGSRAYLAYLRRKKE